MLGETAEVGLLLGELLLELQELLLLALADSVILAGALAALESITTGVRPPGQLGSTPVISM